MIVATLLLVTAQTASATAPVTPVAAVAAPRLNLDTPVETIVADAKGRGVIDADLPELTSHPSYEMFKGMSLNQLQTYAPDKLTAAVLAKVATDLAAIR